MIFLQLDQWNSVSVKKAQTPKMIQSQGHGQQYDFMILKIWTCSCIKWSETMIYFKMTLALYIYNILMQFCNNNNNKNWH